MRSRGYKWKYIFYLRSITQMYHNAVASYLFSLCRMEKAVI